ncbi:MAG: tyrosine-type recombinase/integrase [Acidobacteria bacterium]|nr:tyrosine-type recombinase/integrase [Acidobacteriota bacterium]
MCTPSAKLSKDPISAETRRHHVTESVLQRVIKDAIRVAGLSKPGSFHTLRPVSPPTCWKTFMIRTVQELLGRKDLNTTMINTHALNPGGRGVTRLRYVNPPSQSR